MKVWHSKDTFHGLSRNYFDAYDHSLNRPRRPPRPYLDADVCVEHVHACAQVLVGAFAQEVLDKLVCVFEVVPAASPLPRLAVLQVRSLVARATLHASSAAGLGHRVGKAGRRDGVQEGRLFKPWKKHVGD